MLTGSLTDSYARTHRDLKRYEIEHMAVRDRREQDIIDSLNTYMTDKLNALDEAIGREKHGHASHSNAVVWYAMVWYAMVWYGMVWYGMVWYGLNPLLIIV